MQALAIKYRPKTFDELVGQKTISLSLKYALTSGRLAHAYLFSGLRGSGKTSSARIFARSLVCENGPTDIPCGECSQCLAALGSKHIDIIEMDAASNRGLEDIQALIEQTKYAPSMAKFKIFIIDEVHMLTTQAANALLKTLEEPPAYVKFILATTDPLKLPATVLSRTQHFRFKQISSVEILEHLKKILEIEGVSYEEDALKFIARSGNGSLRDTLTLLDQAIIFAQNELSTAKITDMLGFLDPAKIKAFYSAILQKDKEKVFEFLEELQEYEANVVIDEMLFYLKESFFARSDEFSTLIYERFFRIISRAKNLTSDDDGFKLCVMAFMMIEASNLKEIDNEIKALSQVSSPSNSVTSLNSPAQTSSLNLDPNLASQKTENTQNAYETLLDLIYNRDYELGECFKQNTEFVGFEDGVLSINTWADGEAKERLNKGFKLILMLFKNKFGENVKIEVKKKLIIDESKLQSIMQNLPINLAQNPNSQKPENPAQSPSANLSTHSNTLNIMASFEELKKDAKKYDPIEDTKEALNKFFGNPKIEKQD